MNTRIEALTFDADANLLGAYGSENQLSKLIKIDPATGEGEELGDIGYRGVLGLAFAHDPATSIQNKVNTLPDEFDISQNYPNPFNPSTRISYALPTESRVKIQIFNILGEVVATIVNQVIAAGSHSVEWNASNLSSGVYLYRISAESVSDSKQFNAVKKMILMK